MAVEVRPAKPSDEDQVFELLVQLLDEQITRSEEARALFRELTNSERGCVLVADEDGMVLGLISASFNPAMRYGGNYAQVEEVIVDEQARGKQIGGMLVQAVIDVARSRGCREIGLYPLEGRRPFYEKYGFKYVGEELRQPL